MQVVLVVVVVLVNQVKEVVVVVLLLKVTQEETGLMLGQVLVAVAVVLEKQVIYILDIVQVITQKVVTV
jgi:hypothetical protein